MTGARSIRIATRGSELALWQTHFVRDRLLELHPDLDVDVEVIRTTGDRILDVPLARIGDRGLFTKEIDSALLDGRADVAVHSLKDVPTVLPDGLVIGAVTRRADPRDVLVVREGIPGTLAELPPGARVGTSSLRRRSQLRHVRSDLEIVDLRGNLNTRLGRLDAGDYDAVILAAAGVLRLGWRDRISEFLPAETWLPAVGQGALAVVAREGDAVPGELLHSLHHSETAAAVTAERAFLRALEGGCQVPIGALATASAGVISIDGFVADLDGHAYVRDRIREPADEPGAAGRRLATRLIERGAASILSSVREGSEVPGFPAP